MIVARSDLPMAEDLRTKIALFCDVEPRAVVPLRRPSRPLRGAAGARAEAGVADLIIDRLGLEVAQAPELDGLEAPGRRADASERPKVKIALVGKYVELQDAYMSVREALQPRRRCLWVWMWRSCGCTRPSWRRTRAGTI